MVRDNLRGADSVNKIALSNLVVEYLTDTFSTLIPKVILNALLLRHKSQCGAAAAELLPRQFEDELIIVAPR